MDGFINNLSFEPSKMTVKEKVQLFEKNTKQRLIPTPRVSLYPMNILPKKQESSNSDNNNQSPINQETLQVHTMSSSNEYPKTSSDPPTNSTPSSSSKTTTPSTANSSSNRIPVLKPLTHPLNQIIAKKLTRNSFKHSLDESSSDKLMEIPEILEVFTDLDLFIERELSEIACRKRVNSKLYGQLQNHTVDVFSKLKEEYLKDKQQHQKEFEKQLKHDPKFASIEEDDEDEAESLNLTVNSKMCYMREKKMEKLKLEAMKQETLLAKINRVLEQVRTVDEDSVPLVINIERHYLVASNRLQAALTEFQRLDDPNSPFNPNLPSRKGKCVISEIMLEVKPSYFAQKRAQNEFVVVMLKYNEEVYASKVLCITDDIRVVRFPHKFRVPEAYEDFEMRLEVYGTTFWRKRYSIRETMLKKYGFVSFSLADTGVKRKRFEMLEVITSEHNPLRKKVLMKIRQKITADVHYEGSFKVKLGASWHKAQARLIGHSLEIALDDDDEDDYETIHLDLQNFDSDFVVPVVSHVSMKPFTFLLKFKHYVNGTEFTLLIAANTAEEYTNWVSSINKSLVLLK